MLGGGMPAPIVDVTASMQEAKDRIWAIRRSAGFDRHADAIQRKHGSRASGLSRSTRKQKEVFTISSSNETQLELEL